MIADPTGGGSRAGSGPPRPPAAGTTRVPGTLPGSSPAPGPAPGGGQPAGQGSRQPSGPGPTGRPPGGAAGGPGTGPESASGGSRGTLPGPEQAPSIALPAGGGAIRGIGEKFSANAFTGTASASVPIGLSPSRASFGPQLTLSYDSGAGNGPFGFGWSLSVPSITRKTDKGLPRFDDEEESDVFILAGAEDLVPVFDPDDPAGGILEEEVAVAGETWRLRRYRPRIEGLFARIERWTRSRDGDIHWRSWSKDNVLTLYGATAESRVADPADPRRIFTWLACETRDDRGNAVSYRYRPEDDRGVDRALAHEANRTEVSRSAKHYLDRVRYGNRRPALDREGQRPAFLPPEVEKAGWLFEAVFDYDEGHLEELAPEPGRPASEQHPRVVFRGRPARPWPVRPDPFSSYKATFEVRTYRRCRRVLMVHHIEELGPGSYLVASTDFDYADFAYEPGDVPAPVDAELAHEGSTRIASFLQAVTRSGYRRAAGDEPGSSPGTYVKASLPPVTFRYSRPVVDDSVAELDPASVENLPVGLDGDAYRFVDVDGEGVSGILSEQGGAWFYKPNLGDGHFGPVRTVNPQPSLAALSGGGQRLLDLDGDGRLDVVDFAGSTPGYYERDADEGWTPFRPFRSLPNLAWGDPNLRLVDLTGDGLADVLVAEDREIAWCQSLGEAGFAAPRRVSQALDEERGPRVLLADSTETVYLADCSGDGLSDLVRIRNGEVCYWPNLGYGRFGAKVTMDAAPWFDTPERFDPRRIRLDDIDGSGTTDLIYLGGDGVRLWFNQAGNRWSAPRRLASFPAVDDLASFATVDLRGNGTTCLVWSSPLPGASRRPLRYIDLMGGRKPHLLVGLANNLGAETVISYAPSTAFYLADKAAGRPWITRLPFPVQVVEQVETYDRISRNRFVTRYAYHHGYFDGVEREFRGFGMVEQWDTQGIGALTGHGRIPAANEDGASQVPPVKTRTWFHTGVRLAGSVSRHFAGAEGRCEYYREPGGEEARLLLADTVLPGGLSPEEEREAARALKSLMLRQEVYGLDGSAREAHPYTVVDQTFAVRLVQHRGPNRHALFFTHPREALTFTYERNPADPRLSHRLTLEVDATGNVLKEAIAGYGRRTAPEAERAGFLPWDRQRQHERLVTYNDNAVTNGVFTTGDYRTPVICRSASYELTGFEPTGPGGRFVAADLVALAGGDQDRLAVLADQVISFEGRPTGGRCARLIGEARTRFRQDDLAGLAPLGVLPARAIAGERYRLAFTPGLIAEVFRRAGEALLPDPGAVLGSLGDDGGGYVDLDADGRWWVPSGRVFLSPGTDDASVDELAYAVRHFFAPQRFRDSFGHTASVRWDRHDLLIVETRDPVGNVVTAGERDAHDVPVWPGNDYRVLKPRLVMDPNRNRQEVAFDALGRVTGTAVMGKPGESLGDSLEGFRAELTEAEIVAHIAHPFADPEAVLGPATTRTVYNPFASPPVVYALSRETHAAALAHGEATKIQHAFGYSDGYGREIQRKGQAGEDGGQRRWVGTGWTVFNNKGQPVRRFEPFFSATHRFEFDLRIGVSPVLVYDPPGRVVATLHPNHAWEKAVFDAWHQETWDVNDTVTADPTDDPDVGGYLRRLPVPDVLPTWYALRTDPAYIAAFEAQYPDPARREAQRQASAKAARHAGTPATVHLDVLGRAFLTVGHNRIERDGAAVDEWYPTRTELDIQGNARSVRDAVVENGDARGRLVVRSDYDVAGTRLHEAGLEAGERWALADVAGNPVRAWDSRRHDLRSGYDALRRPRQTHLRTAGGVELRVLETFYGEPEGPARNLRGRVHRQFDQAGVATNAGYDFKGNLVEATRRLLAEYRHTVDWAASPELEAEVFTEHAGYDALNRVTNRQTADGSVAHPAYDERNLLVRLDIALAGVARTPFVTGIDYNARGQRLRIGYGNGSVTGYGYDPFTFRLEALETRRDGVRLQDLAYAYDPAGNVTAIADDAAQDVFFDNAVVRPGAGFTYDAVYRLTEASGREHAGQHGHPVPSSWDDRLQLRLPLPGDGQAMRRYTERYDYDAVGNVLRLAHAGPAGGWARQFRYEEPSLLEAAKTSNRLSASALGDAGPAERYTYDAHGNMTSMPQIHTLHWDYCDELHATVREVRDDGGTPETTYYVYDASGERVRKVTEGHAGADESPRRVRERIYLPSFERFRELGPGGEVRLERHTLHVMDDGERIALVETRTHGHDRGAASLTRYQLTNQIGSAVLELDREGRVISYEEYTPYGSTSYQAVEAQVETPKRYRYTGRERDEESGLYYHGARYYAPWLARWVSADPAGLGDGVNRYAYVRDNPITRADPTGTQGTEGGKKDPGKAAADDAEAKKKKEDEEPLGGIADVPVPSPDPNLRLNPPNLWYSTQSQGSGLRELAGVPASRFPGLWDVEAFGNLTGSRFGGLGGTQYGGGLTPGGLSLRYSLPGTGSLDVGGTVSGGYTSQGATGGAVATRGISYLALVHGALRFGGPITGGLYLQAGGVTQQTSDPGGAVGKGPVSTSGTVQVVGAIAYEPPDEPPKPFTLGDLRREPDNPYVPSVTGVLNPTFSYTQTGQLSQGPAVRDLVTVGGIAGVNFTWGGAEKGSSFTLTPEFIYFHSFGSALPASSGGTGQGASSDTYRGGLVGTYSWLDRSAHGTSSVAFGLWYSREAGNVTGPATSSSPSGAFHTDTLTLGGVFSFRRIPLLGN